MDSLSLVGAARRSFEPSNDWESPRENLHPNPNPSTCPTARTLPRWNRDLSLSDSGNLDGQHTGSPEDPPIGRIGRIKTSGSAKRPSRLRLGHFKILTR